MSLQVLQLTHSDASKLKRDPSVGDEEISYADGVMTFLGVLVVEGAKASTLAEKHAAVDLPGPVKAEVIGMAKGQKKSNKEVRKPKAEKPKPVTPSRTFTTPPSNSH